MSDRTTWESHSGEVLLTKRGFDVIDCERCGFQHAVPLPTTDELQSTYRQEYYTLEKPLFIERVLEDLEWWNLTFNDRYDTFEELLPTGRRRLLDIGSGPGFFCKRGKDRGWDVFGIEPSAQASAKARELGIDVAEEFFDADMARGLRERFDVVHMSEVLEHVPDPRGILEAALEVLAPGGLLCILVPNDFNPFQRVLLETCGFEPWWVAPPHHLNYFNRGSLSRLVECVGFDVVSTEATFPIDMFLLMGVDYVGNDAVGRECHRQRMHFERNLSLAGATGVKRDLYKSLCAQGLGREVMVFGRKPESDGEAT